jgi:NADH-ubiquinone oxidoreductase chain 5
MDLKKIIAYSTCSQMGYLVFCSGIAKFDIAFFHLINHAFFKCLLFISAGVLIHSFFNEQDIRKYGGLIKLFPFVWIILIVASLSLMGIPFLSGFYSKEKIIEYSFYIYNSNNLIAFWFSNLSAFLTAVYSMRLLIYSFIHAPNNYKRHYEVLHLEFPLIINSVLFVLGLGAIFSGFILNDLLMGLSTDLFNYTSNYLSIYSLNIHLGNFHLNFLTFKYTILGILFYLMIINYKKKFNSLFYYFYNNNNLLLLKNNLLVNNLNDSILKNIYFFFSKKWFINYIYNSYITQIVFYLGYSFTFKIMDKGYLEFFSFFFFIKNNNSLTNFLNYKLYKFNYFEEILFLIVLTFFIYFYFFLNILTYSDMLFFSFLFVSKKRTPIVPFLNKIKKKNNKKLLFSILNLSNSINYSFPFSHVIKQKSSESIDNVKLKNKESETIDYIKNL